MGRQSLSHPHRKVAQPGEEKGAPIRLWGRGVPRALTPSSATGQGPSLTELAPSRLPNTDMNPPQPPGPSSQFPTPNSCGLAPRRAAPQLTSRLCTRTPACACPEALPWHQALLLPAHCPPHQAPQEAGAQLAQPHSLADPAEALHGDLGEGKEPEEGKEEVGAGLVGTGWVAGRQLAGRLRPQAAWAWSGGGGAGRGRAQLGCI